jgi:5-methylcytosine-specific restriction enzyme A
MPWRPRRPCPAPGCQRLLAPGQRCPDHTPPRTPFATSTYRTRHAIPDTLRQQILERDGYRCVICGQPANVVDHIIPRSAGGTDDPANLQSLCTYHSRRKTGAEGAAARLSRE